jgi:hypothetical protein
MLLFMDRRGGPAADPGEAVEMQRFADALASRGQLRRSGRLGAEAAGARVRVRDGRASVTDGPFAESPGAVVGFWVIEAASRDEALDLARACPHARHGVVEVHLARGRDAVPDAGDGIPFLFAFRMEPGLGDPDGAKMREMIAFGDTLKRRGTFVETAPLARDPAPARVEARGGKTVVTDGPFAEAKEVVGGYAIVRAASRAEAVDVAVRYPHAKWGPVEVREIVP